MRSSFTSTGNPHVTTATTATAAATTTTTTTTTNESFKTAYEGEVLDESDIEHLFQIFAEICSNSSSSNSRKKGIDGRQQPQQQQRRFDISGSNLVGDGSYYIADCFLTYRDYEYDLINLGYTLLQLKGR